jgi:hypothetical protein
MFPPSLPTGGMIIANNHSVILHNNALINIHTIEAARVNGVKRLLYTSSACVYPEFKQTDANVSPLKEDDAYPAFPQDAYGWEKLITERLCIHYRQDYGLDTRNVPSTTFSVRLAPGTGAGKKRPRPSAARSPTPNSPAITRSKSGATANRRAASATSTIASKASTA